MISIRRVGLSLWAFRHRAERTLKCSGNLRERTQFYGGVAVSHRGARVEESGLGI